MPVASFVNTPDGDVASPSVLFPQHATLPSLRIAQQWASPHGGGNERGNRITVGAAHHLHGIHAGVVRVEGTAPDGLYWEAGCAPGRGPLMRLHGDSYA